MYALLLLYALCKDNDLSLLRRPRGVSRISFRGGGVIQNIFEKVGAFAWREVQWRSEGGRGGGASAPGRRPEGGAKILPKNFKKFI